MTTTTTTAQDFHCNKIFNDDDDNNESIINECYPDYIVTLGTLIGKGTYGEVYNGTITMRKRTRMTSNVAIKISSYFDQEYIINEIRVAYNMSELDIGPKVYHAFYIKLGDNNYRSFIIMELFENNVSNLLEDDNYSLDFKQQIMEQTHLLLEKQILDLKLVCLDTKPQNTVFKNEEVRFIDFGTIMCGSINDYDLKDKDLWFYFILTQYVYLCINDLIRSKNNAINIKVILQAFSDDVGLKEFLENDFLDFYESLSPRSRTLFDHYLLPSNSKSNKMESLRVAIGHIYYLLYK